MVWFLYQDTRAALIRMMTEFAGTNGVAATG
jgi:hypothetical protein